MNYLIIGEVCEDVFYYGRSDRLSPEAPVPVFTPESIIVSPGMAGNVERNLAAILKSENRTDKISTIFSAMTGQKIRYVDKKTNHYFLRVDHGDKSYNKMNITKREIKLIKSADAIIISDYSKGFLSARDIVAISCEKKKGAMIFLDTKKKLTKSILESVSFVKINKKEFDENFQKNKHEKYINKLVVTLGDAGATYKHKIYSPIKKHTTMDVSGAGDTFMAAFAYQYMKSRDASKAINFANTVSGEVVSKRGVSTI